MKFRHLTTLILSCGVAFAMVSSLAAQTVQGHATVVRIKGAARYSQGGNWSPLRVGDVLKPGSLVQTGLDKGSYVDLVLSDGDGAAALPPSMNAPAVAPDAPAASVGYRAHAEQNVVRINENSALGIDRLTSQNTGADIVTDTQLDLKQGRITGNVKKLSPASKYEIKIPSGVAGIRGTIFDISADGVVRVTVGSVVLAHVNANGDVITQIVNSNEQYDARSNRLTTLGSGAIQSINEVGVQLRAGAQAGIQSTLPLDQTARRVSPSKGKGKGKGPGPFDDF